MYLFINFFFIVCEKKTKCKVKTICHFTGAGLPEVHRLSQTETCCGRLSEMWFDLLGGQTYSRFSL